jgi:anti-sigma regulatory factor (Ser/Thr protein kinase)
MPAVLVWPESAATTLLTDGGSVPLAVRRSQPRPQATRTLPSGSTLMLYTDGLVERKHESIDDGIARVAAVLAQTTTLPVDQVADAVLREQAPAAGYDDDVAMVIYRHGHTLLRIETDATAGQLAGIRHRLADWLRAEGVEEELAADIVLVVNEACTNCVEHAYGEDAVGTMLLDVEVTDSEVRTRITDQGSWKEPAANPGNGGRGLMLMRALSDSVEIDTGPTGTTADIAFRLPTGAD